MSAYVIPCVVVCILLWAGHRGTDVYAAFARGVGKGLGVLGQIFPPMLLMTAMIDMLDSVGAVEALAGMLAAPARLLGLPAECLPLMVLRPFSGSGGLSMGLALMEQYGVDSYIGRTAAVMLGAAETSFYTVGLYAARLEGREVRRILCAALVGDLCAFLSAAFFVRLLM